MFVLHTAHVHRYTQPVPYAHRYFPIQLEDCYTAAGWRGCGASALFEEEVASPPAAPYRCCIVYAGRECPDIGPFAAVECAGKDGVRAWGLHWRWTPLQASWHSACKGRQAARMTQGYRGRHTGGAMPGAPYRGRHTGGARDGYYCPFQEMASSMDVGIGVVTDMAWDAPCIGPCRDGVSQCEYTGSGRGAIPGHQGEMVSPACYPPSGEDRLRGLQSAVPLTA